MTQVASRSRALGTGVPKSSVLRSPIVASVASEPSSWASVGSLADLVLKKLEITPEASNKGSRSVRSID
jgi:hypothetical protein